ncbi:MAG: hypothetical protein AseanaTS_20940 [Candidatus Pelagadaptatus aseana]|uniref:glucosaminidase domain-containing protein n=1 Tax=Candidatus Pelagadaptatus aseana TaxID=3120508 RepID=UPI0039B21E5B
MSPQQPTPSQKPILGIAFLGYAIACLTLTFWLISHQQQISSKHNLKTMAGSLLPISPIISHRTAPDFAAIGNVQEKKQRFFEFLLPAIHQQNATLSQQRQWLIAQKHNNAPTTEQLATVQQLAKRYRVPDAERLSYQALIDELLVHVDIIPAALVLAQAANESAWGTSRFATEANNYFGQWCFSSGCGVVPKQRNTGATHEVARFKSADASVEAYFLNLNRNQSYRKLRRIRAEMRKNNQKIDAIQLAEGLEHYSSRGEAYIEELQAMIRYNKLQQYPDILESKKAAT